MIQGGHVAVRGRIVRDPDLWVDPGADRISLDGKPLRPRELICLALNKPAGIVTTRSDERGRSTVYDLLPPGTPWLFPVGRLDKESSGLLLMTNDTRFGQRVSGSGARVPKTYTVCLDRQLAEQDAATMRHGMTAAGVRYKEAAVEIDAVNPYQCTVILMEGKNRQIRKMFDALCYQVVLLRRVGIGPVRLGTLREGETRPLSAVELGLLGGIGTGERSL
jgi:23S rRNA pseudouridine2605 synthase